MSPSCKTHKGILNRCAKVFNKIVPFVDPPRAQSGPGLRDKVMGLERSDIAGTSVRVVRGAIQTHSGTNKGCRLPFLFFSLSFFIIFLVHPLRNSQR
jgi:hypothetical protein